MGGCEDGAKLKSKFKEEEEEEKRKEIPRLKEAKRSKNWDLSMEGRIKLALQGKKAYLLIDLCDTIRTIRIYPYFQLYYRIVSCR